MEQEAYAPHIVDQQLLSKTSWRTFPVHIGRMLSKKATSSAVMDAIAVALQRRVCEIHLRASDVHRTPERVLPGAGHPH